jgi:hypothetical protein
MIAALALVAAVTPTYVVERVANVAGEVRRVSVYRDGSAALVRTVGAEKSVARQTLAQVELDALTQIVGESYDDLARFASFREVPGTEAVELRLAPPGRDALTVRLAGAAVPALASVRLLRALDDLEARLTLGRSEREDLRVWLPQVGERVELEDGRIAEVVEVLEANETQVVRVRVNDGPLNVFYPLAELRRLAVRRVKP